MNCQHVLLKEVGGAFLKGRCRLSTDNNEDLMPLSRVARVLFLSIALAWAPVRAQAPIGPVGALTPDQQLARDIFAELIGINTTHEHGNTTPAAEAVARRLLAAGFPAADVQVIGPRDQNKNVVARLRGTGKRKPILLLAHLDVVEAL